MVPCIIPYQVIVWCSLYENEGIRPDLMPWLEGLVEISEYQNMGVDILEIRHSPCHIFHLASRYFKWSYWPCIFFNNSFNYRPIILNLTAMDSVADKLGFLRKIIFYGGLVCYNCVMIISCIWVLF